MKNKLNYQWLNTLILVAIVCLLYLIKDLWIGTLSTIFNILSPFVLAFAISYAVYPIVKKLTDSGSPKWLAILVVGIIGLGGLIIIILLAVPMLYEQTLTFLSNISTFLSDISTKYAINLGEWQTTVKDLSGTIIKNVGAYISNGAVSIVNTSVNFFTNFAIIVCVSLYLLNDMDKIRNWLKEYLLRTKRRTYQYVKKLDSELNKYIGGLGMNILAQTIEYTVAFLLIGHPNYLILGIISGVSCIIPMFGGVVAAIISLLISSVISTKVFIGTVIICIICPNIDGYVIGPKIYGKSNKIPPLITIFAVFAGGALGGFWGIVLSLPIAIIIRTTYIFYQKDIERQIGKIHKNRRKEGL